MSDAARRGFRRMLVAEGDVWGARWRLKPSELHWERLQVFELLAKAARERRGNTFVFHLGESEDRVAEPS